MHVLFHCDVSAQSRISAGLEQFVMPRLQQNSNLRELIFNICSSNDKHAGIFATLVWVLWNNRNNKIWNDTTEQGRSLGYKAKHLWEEWFSVQHIQSGQHTPVQQQQVLRWQKPPYCWYKCNIDAAFHSEQQRTSAGWILRDHHGMFVRAGTTWVEGNCSVIEGEALALLTALRELQEQGMSHVIIESDSQSLVNAIPHVHAGNSEFSTLVCKIKDIMLLNPNFMVRFVKRQANLVAHSLARAASSWPRRCLFDSLPLCIATSLHNEMI
jgi:ribonuclease HI